MINENTLHQNFLKKKIKYLSRRNYEHDTLFIEDLINKPYLNLIIDDMDSLTGIKTRLESFVDILEQRKQKN